MVGRRLRQRGNIPFYPLTGGNSTPEAEICPYLGVYSPPLCPAVPGMCLSCSLIGVRVEFFVFISQEWLLVSTLVVLIYIYAWRERVKNGRPIGTQEATALINSDAAVWLDVRDAADFAAGHMVDALHIPHSKIDSELEGLEKHRDKTIIVVDKLGQHAGRVGRTLGNKGFTVRRLSGGIAEWRNQSLPLVKS